jgi:bacillithiol system protein YtxJ
MSIFDKFFGNSGNSDDTQWPQLRTVAELDQLEDLSMQKPVIFFKHSTRCSVSRMVLKQLERQYSIPREKAEIILLDLLSYREISNEIASRYQITHQSPQALVVYKKRCVYNTSHEDIDAAALSEAVDKCKDYF